MTKKMIATDWIAIKSRYFEVIFLTAFTIAMISMNGMVTMIFILMAAVFAQNCAAEPFIVEEKGDLQQFYLSLPLSRKSIVRGRYVFMLICVVVMLGLSVGLALIISPTIEFLDSRFDVTPSIIIMIGFVSFAASSLFNIFCYPIMFRYGFSKGKIIGFFVPIIIVGSLLGLFVYWFGDIIKNDPDRLYSMLTYITENATTVATVVSLISLGVGLVLYFASYCISMKIYLRRSF
jgi:hypothetical protein